jgi:hypothetical protein
MKKNPRLEAELAELAKLADSDIDTSDIPETLNWTGAEVGRFYRPNGAFGRQS